MPTYTTSAEVARVLRSSADGRIRLSSQALTQIRTQTSETNTSPVSSIAVDYQSIVIADSFQGKKRLKFNFTSATEFDVYDIDQTARQELFAGSGDIATQFVSADGNFTIPAGTFSGTIATGNQIYLEFDAHISVDDVNSYIDDSEVEIDTMLSAGFVGYLTDGATRLYPSTVPPAIALACQYLTAYYVYTDVFRAKFKEEEDFGRNYSNRWKKRAENTLEKYAKVARRSLPRVISFPSFIDKFGLKSVAPAPSEIQKTVSDIGREANAEQIFEPGDTNEVS